MFRARMRTFARVYEHLAAQHMYMLVRYGLIGVFGAGIQVAVLWFWVALLGRADHYQFGVVLGFLIALATTFPLQKYWTFRETSHKEAPRQMFWYTLIALASLALNVTAISFAKGVFDHINVDFFEYWYLLTEGVIVTVVAGLSFLSNRILTFKNIPEQSL